MERVKELSPFLKWSQLCGSWGNIYWVRDLWQIPFHFLTFCLMWNILNFLLLARWSAGHAHCAPTLANWLWLVWHAKGGQQKCLIKILSTCDFSFCFCFFFNFELDFFSLAFLLLLLFHTLGSPDIVAYTFIKCHKCLKFILLLLLLLQTVIYSHMQLLYALVSSTFVKCVKCIWNSFLALSFVIDKCWACI